MKVLIVLCICFVIAFQLTAQTVDAGNGHALVLNEEKGCVLTVGRNDHGQLGIGNYENKSVPVLLGIENVVTISRGYDHSMVIDEGGVLWGWGNNRFGQLGVSGKEDVMEPEKVITPFKMVQCEGGYDHSVFIDEYGCVWAVGFNEHGELGNGRKQHSSQFVKVQLKNGEQLKNIAEIVSVGSHSLALDSLGNVFSWGANYYGELGHFKIKEQPYAEKIEGLEKITAIAVGWAHSNALNEEGDVFAWGAKPETYGGTTGAKTAYYEGVGIVTNLPRIETIACGSWHSVAIDKRGRVWGWGWNQYGMLGDGTTENRADPVLMEGVENAQNIGGGCFQTLVVDSAGTIFACGDNNFGQLGIANEDRKLTLTKLVPASSEQNVTHFILMAIFFSLIMATGTAITLFYRLRNSR